MACGNTYTKTASIVDYIRETLQNQNINDELLSDEDIAQMFLIIGDKVAVKAAIERKHIHRCKISIP